MAISSVSVVRLRAGSSGPFFLLLQRRFSIHERSITLWVKNKNQKCLVEPGTRSFVFVRRSRTHTQYPSKRPILHTFNSDLHACTPARCTSNVHISTSVLSPTHNTLQNVSHSLLCPSLQNGVVVAFLSVKYGLDGAVQVTRAIINTFSFVFCVFHAFSALAFDVLKLSVVGVQRFLIALSLCFLAASGSFVRGTASKPYHAIYIAIFVCRFFLSDTEVSV